ncbi:MAG TPA: DUF1820 family protein [Gammaproteobacteria bacterium]|nr:DUF1820 family protein [Gammaproteobacteria bacterium]
MAKVNKPTFRIQFHNNNKIYELYAHEVSQSQMAGFIEIGEIIFGEHSKLLIDPAEEKLKHEFADVRHSYIPHFAVIRIDEVERSGKNRILDNDGASITSFPGQASIPRKS